MGPPEAMSLEFYTLALEAVILEFYTLACDAVEVQATFNIEVTRIEELSKMKMCSI